MAPTDFKKVNVDDAQSLTVQATPQRRMSLPFQPLTVAFKNINYYVDMPKVNG